MPKHSDPDKVEQILRMRENGDGYKKIAKALDMSPSSVQYILSKEGTEKEESAPDAKKHTHARAYKRKGTDKGTEKGTENPNLSVPSVVVPTLPAPLDTGDFLSKEHTIEEMAEYVRFYKGCTMAAAANPELTVRDREWAIANHGKRWCEGIRLMAQCTGLDKAMLDAPESSPLDQLAEQIARYDDRPQEDEPDEDRAPRQSRIPREGPPQHGQPRLPDGLGGVGPFL